MIVPVYQVENYISQCIESVLNQTFQDFELILIDDGSKDKSGIICDSYAAMDNRIIVIHTENRGAAAARNIGLDRASGRYITFLDGDDYLAENMIGRLYDVINHSEYDMVVCDFLNILPDEKDNFSLHLQEMKINGREVLSHWKMKKNYGVWTVVWNKIYKREILENLRFPEGKFFEDEFFSDQLYLRCKNIQVIQDILCFHRVLASSTMNTHKTRNYLDLLDVFKTRIELYLEQDFPIDEVYKILICMLEPYSKCATSHFQGQDRKRLREGREFIRNTSCILIKKELSLIKKGSLLAISIFPSITFQIANRFRSQLEKYL
ncbi:MAG: glycosyltransferase family 2 protein [Frisingicoccus sp.]|uniref:glycosyltransferase family 2 protein n=1 Tax=Frisingicoccus sp. TaxID=1918627 RepID=UPI0026380726|nr:glycosyltransferase family 2 protein [Frisingicoccus sp.]MDD6233549.1 glycosyltransferase family 2 protein [Frisingicoccus sp.]